MNLDRNNLDRAHDSVPDQMDQLLVAHFASGEELAPSSGFALSVMEALHAETAAPPPLPFPWRRVVPGLITVLCAMVCFGIFALRELRGVAAAGAGPQHGLVLRLTPGQFHLTPLEQALCWVAASAFVAIAAIAGAIRLAGGRSTMRI